MLFPSKGADSGLFRDRFQPHVAPNVTKAGSLPVDPARMPLMVS
jgi:hypothetical protein